MLLLFAYDEFSFPSLWSEKALEEFKFIQIYVVAYDFSSLKHIWLIIIYFSMAVLVTLEKVPISRSQFLLLGTLLNAYFEIVMRCYILRSWVVPLISLK